MYRHQFQSSRDGQPPSMTSRNIDFGRRNPLQRPPVPRGYNRPKPPMPTNSQRRTPPYTQQSQQRNYNQPRPPVPRYAQQPQTGYRNQQDLPPPSTRPKLVKHEVPPWLEEYLVSNILQDLEDGNYISASTQSRTLLNMSEHSNLSPEVIALANRSNQVLSRNGFTEQRFLLAMQAHIESQACPPGSILPNKDGGCPTQYFPILGQNNKTKCCAKIKQEIKRMDEENRSILSDMKKDRATLSDNRDRSKLQQEFERRFGLAKGTDSHREKDEMLSSNILPSTRKFIKNQAKQEEQRLKNDLPQAIKNNEGHRMVGMSPGLFLYLYNKFKNVASFVNWYVNHDWTRWWVAIYIFRVLSMFVCMWLKAENVKDWMDQLAAQYFGVKPITLFLAASWGPMILAGALFNVLMNTLSGGKLFMAVFNGIQGALGSFMTIGFFHFRIMNLLTTFGFTADLATMIQDIFTLVKEFGGELLETGSVTQAISNSLAKTTVKGGKTIMSGYCNRKIQSFFSQSLKLVQMITFNVFHVICLGITKLLTMGPGILMALGFNSLPDAAGESVCNALTKTIKSFVSYYKVSMSINNIINGEVVFEKDPKNIQEARENMNDLHDLWGKYGPNSQSSGPTMGGPSMGGPSMGGPSTQNFTNYSSTFGDPNIQFNTSNIYSQFR